MKKLAAMLLGSTRMPMKASTPPEEGAPAATVEGVVQEGETLRTVSEAPAPTPEGAATEEPAADRPSEWPEGVNSWEDFGKLSPEDRAKALAPKAEEAAKEPLSDEQQQVLTQSLEGVAPEMAAKASPFVESFIRNGTLSDAEVADAAKATGFSEAMVRQYMRGGDPDVVAGTEAAQVAPVYELVGGEANFPAFQQWANEALGPQQHAQINEAMGLSPDGNTVVGDPDPAKLQEFTDAFKSSGRAPAPRDITQQADTVSDQSASTDVFASATEQSKAINDPRYRTDATYRKSVEAKVGRSNIQ